MTHTRKATRTVVTVGLVAALSLAGCGFGNGPDGASTPAAAAAIPDTPDSTTAQPAPTGFEAIPDLAAELDASVVSIAIAGRGTGSGVVYDSDGYVITNAHVVGNASTVEVEFADGTRSDATVIGTDEITDLAVLRTVRRGLTAARFATGLPRVGELVIAMGSPLGFQNSVTAGIVSGLGREIPGAAAAGARALVDLIQTDAAISPGNSGGALVNARGEVVGINEAYLPPASGAVSIGFAIPAATVVSVVDQLIATGSAVHAFFGVAVVTLTPQIAEAFGLTVDEGALVQSVASPSPAATAGLQAGDVLTTFNGERVETAEEFLAALRGATPGSPAEVTLQRGSRELTQTVMLGTMSESPDARAPANPGARRNRT